MKELVKILYGSNSDKGWANSKAKLNDTWWTPPKFTSSGLPLKGFLIGKINWAKYINNLDPQIKTALGGSKATSFLYPEKMDKYLIKLWTRLHKYAANGQTEKYDNLVKVVCAHSKALRILTMCHIEPNWTSKFSLGKSRWWYKGIKWMLSSQEPYFQYKRIMIPKLSGGERPLSVPNIVARATARVQYLFIQVWIHGSKSIDSNKMHGTTLGTGVGTAIKAVMQKLDSKYIYEFDVAKFFNSVNLFTLGKLWNVQTIALNDDSYSRDFVERFPGWLYRWVINSIEIGRKSLPREQMELEHKLESELTQQEMQLEHVHLYNYLRSSPHITPEKNPMTSYTLNAKLAVTDFGLPQGYAPSPILSSMALVKILAKYDIVMYVDDGLIFSDSVINLEQLQDDFNEATGLTLALSKSHWVKWNGSWKKDLDFLGIKICEDGKIGSRKVKPFHINNSVIKYKRKVEINQGWEFINWLKNNQKDTNKLIAWLNDPNPESISENLNHLKWRIHKKSLTYSKDDLRQFLNTDSKRSPTQMVSLISPFGGEVCIRDFIKPDQDDELNFPRSRSNAFFL